MRVLLVEDDRELADYVRRALEEEHYSVTTCFDGSSGLKAIQTGTFDLLVLEANGRVLEAMKASGPVTNGTLEFVYPEDAAVAYYLKRRFRLK